jgi:hypothetical protein
MGDRDAELSFFTLFSLIYRLQLNINHTKFWLASLTGRDHSVDLGVDGRVILNES